MNAVLKRTLTGALIAAIVLAAVLLAPLPVITGGCAVLWSLAMVELFLLARRRADAPRRAGAALILFGVLLATLFAVLPRYAAHSPHHNLLLLYIIAIVKFSDIGGFAFGLTSARLMTHGNHKLCPNISPNKSWEGLLGSVVSSLAISCAFMPVTQFSVGKSLAFGLTAALVGTFGDLLESKFKRWVGVKDSSAMTITNGMGGLLDMFDSLLLAPAVLLPFL